MSVKLGRCAPESWVGGLWEMVMRWVRGRWMRDEGVLGIGGSDGGMRGRMGGKRKGMGGGEGDRGAVRDGLGWRWMGGTG